jgi:tRNA(His) 5'-end guanylyltransferase
MRILQETMFLTVKDLESATFGYHQHGEISFILKQIDEESPDPYGNKIQDINSIISSLITMNFMKQYMASDDPPDIIGDAVFKTITFNTPSVSEAINYLIGQQYLCHKTAVSIVAEEEISRLPNVSSIDFLNRRTMEEKKMLLDTECNIIFDEEYKNYFKYGTCSFKAPKVFKNESRKKWIMEETAPDFSSDREFVLNIVKTGQDIFRAERDIQG